MDDTQTNITQNMQEIKKMKKRMKEHQDIKNPLDRETSKTSESCIRRY